MPLLLRSWVATALLRVGCARFPADARVRVPGGVTKRMEDVNYGDLVLVVSAGAKDRFEEVHTISHANATASEEYVVLNSSRLDGSAPKALRLWPDNMLPVCAAPAGAPKLADCPLAPAHRVRPGMAVRRLGAGGAPELAVVTAVSLETLVGSYHVHANWENCLLYVDDHVVAEFPLLTSANATADATHNATVPLASIAGNIRLSEYLYRAPRRPLPPRTLGKAVKASFDGRFVRTEFLESVSGSGERGAFWDVGAAFGPPSANDSNVHATAGQRLSHVEFFSTAATGSFAALVNNVTVSAPPADADSIESLVSFGGRGFDMFDTSSLRDLATSAAPTSTRAPAWTDAPTPAPATSQPSSSLRPTPAPTFVGTAGEEPFSSDADCASGSCAFAGRRALLFGYFALLVGYYANR
ncbi:hypothetical protein M885DRAFT_562121 [Pelagophyceae sp. CCMP2097]|nr:hypothetical protein M885DRAFT_562121 [Pelagophyceae sp. CCMP2097]